MSTMLHDSAFRNGLSIITTGVKNIALARLDQFISLENKIFYMRKIIFIISGLLLMSAGSFGQVFKIVLNQPDLLSVNPGRDTLICKNHSVVLGGIPTAFGGTEDYTYMWSPFDGLDDPTSPNPEATPTQSTKYILTVTDAYGCHLTDFINVTVDACLGIDQDLIIGDLAIYPNPSAGAFTISGLPVNGQNIKVSLINSMGREILSRWIPDGSESADFDLAGQGLPKGVYFFRIMTNKQVLVRRIQMI